MAIFKKMIFIVVLLLISVSNVYADAETEPNNTKETSDVLTSGTTMSGQLMSVEDEDWFSITTTGPDTINIDFKNSYTSTSSDDYWYITIQDSIGTLLSKVAVLSDSYNVGVSKAGQYFIIITYCYRFRTDVYTITATWSNGSPGCTVGCTQDQLDAAYNRGYSDGLGAGCSGLIYSEQDMNNMVQSILTWGDTNGDGKIGLAEAIAALRVTINSK